MQTLFGISVSFGVIAEKLVDKPVGIYKITKRHLEECVFL